MTTEFQKITSAALVVVGLATLTWHFRLVHFATDAKSLNHKTDDPSISTKVFDSYPPDKSSDILIAIEAEIVVDMVQQQSRNITVTQLIDEISANITWPVNETITYDLDDMLTNATEMIAMVNSSHFEDLAETLNSTTDELNGYDVHESNSTAADIPYNNTVVAYF
jgi:hypothetical protein